MGKEELGERSEGVGKTEFYIVDMCEILRVNKKPLHEFKSTDRVTMAHRLSWPIYKPRGTVLVLC